MIFEKKIKRTKCCDFTGNHSAEEVDKPWCVNKVLSMLLLYCLSILNCSIWSLLYLQLVHYLQKVNFSTPFGDQVSFDENGDALPIYDVMNWLWLPGGRIQVQNVGEVRRSASRSEELILDEDKIFWNFKSKEVIYLFQTFPLLECRQQQNITE